MPYYSADPDGFPGSTMVPFWPCRVIDGAGDVVQWCQTVNTDTGEVVRLYTCSGGHHYFDHKTGGAKTVTEFRPLPVRLEPLGCDEPVIVDGGKDADSYKLNRGMCNE